MKYQDLVNHLMTLDPLYLQREIFAVDQDGTYWEINEIKHYEEDEVPDLLPLNCSVLLLGDCLKFSNDIKEEDEIWINNE